DAVAHQDLAVGYRATDLPRAASGFAAALGQVPAFGLGLEDLPDRPSLDLGTVHPPSARQGVVDRHDAALLVQRETAGVESIEDVDVELPLRGGRFGARHRDPPVSGTYSLTLHRLPDPVNTQFAFGGPLRIPDGRDILPAMRILAAPAGRRGRFVRLP